MDNNGREICKFLQSLGAMSGTSFYIEIRGDSFLRLPHSYQLPLLILLLLLSNIKVFGLTTFSQTSSNSFFSMKVTKTSQTYKTYEIIASYISVFVAWLSHEDKEPATYRPFATRVSQIKIWNFLVVDVERNVCKCYFNRYSVITQFAKLAAGEQLFRRLTHRKL